MVSMRLAALALASLLLAACKDAPAPPAAGVNPNDTSVLGSARGPQPTPGALRDASGRPVPAPPLPRETPAQMALVAPDTALALWIEDGRAVSAAWTPSFGWSAAQPLERIFGQASDGQLASNGRGEAMALWRHTVGNIESLRFSRYEAGRGWTTPDVMPGALPRSRPPGAAAGRPAEGAPRLTMDPAGNAVAQWPSGFDERQFQTARFEAGRGWTRAESQPMAQGRDPAQRMGLAVP
jgi:hypothetical protein